MTTIARIPRAARRPSLLSRMLTGWRMRPGANVNASPVPVETRAPRLLDAVEMAEIEHTRREAEAGRERMSHFAELRGGWNDDEPPRCDLPWTTLLVAALIGGGLWLMIFHAIWSALTADPSMMEF